MSELIPVLVDVGNSALQAHTASRQNRETMNAYRAQVEAQARQVKQAQEIDERRRNEQLRRVLAAQRAAFGAGGVGSGAGSAEAVLRGLTERAERESLDDQAVARSRLEDIQRAYLTQRRRNLLEAANSRGALAYDLLRQGVRAIPLLRSVGD